MTTQQDNPVSDSGNVSGLPKSVGKILGEAREQHGLSVFDVSNRIKFAPRQIEALEADDFVLLPEAAFVRGFVRSYARLLQLEPEPLLAALPSSHAQAAATHEIKSVEIPMPSALSARRHNIVWLAGALVVALSLAVFVRVRDHAPAAEPESKTIVQAIELPGANLGGASAPVAEQAEQSEHVTQQPVHTAPVAAPAPAKVVKNKVVQKESGQAPVIASETKKPAKVKTELASTETASTERAKPVRAPVKPVQQETVQKEVVRRTPVAVAPDGSANSADAAVKVKPGVNFSEHALRLEFDEDAWVEIKDGNDKILISRMHRAGSLLRVAGKSPLDVTIGNAKAVRLFDKGKKINLGRYTTADVARLKLN